MGRSHNMGAEQKRRLRAAVIARDGEACRKCGVASNLTLDHVKPRSRGGRNHLKNLRLLCQTCNPEKGDGWRR